MNDQDMPDLLRDAREVCAAHPKINRYKPGEGFIHYATGDYWPTELEMSAIRWRVAADAAERIAAWMRRTECE